MPRHDLCLAWNWEYDADFVRLLAEACARHGLSFISISPEILSETLASLSSGEFSFAAMLDRACEADAAFQPLADWAREHGAFRINPQEQSRWSEDKATMHLEFISRGLQTPYTIILPPFADQPEFPVPDLTPLGGRFAIKPARGGGGEGVVLEACAIEQVNTARQAYPHEKVLLQAHVTPQMLDSRPAWFRVIYCTGANYSCWWDPSSHVYASVTADEKARFGLRSLREVAARITQICRLDLFSTEIALTPDGLFVIVDYVNDQIDLRLQSEAADGVPDAVVASIAGRLAGLVENHRKLP